ncbi:hypothetical protein GEMRC1_012763 [Eukaryota sp. GEM-RC1]
MPNILLVSDFFYPSTGGVETHILSLARELSLKHSVFVLTRDYPSHRGCLTIAGISVHFVSFPKLKSVSIPLYPFIGSVLSSIIKEHSIDIIHCHQIFSTLSLFTLLCSSFLKIPVLLTNHSLIGFETGSVFIKFLLPHLIRGSTCRTIISVSNSACKNIQQFTGLVNRKLSHHVIPNGIGSECLPIDNRCRQYSKILISCVFRHTSRKGTSLYAEVLIRFFKFNFFQ